MTTAAAPAPETPALAITPIAAVVPLSDLYPSPTNPRKHFDGIEELAASLTEKGVDIPLIVRTRDSAQGRLEVVDGERRYRAAHYAGLQFVPVILRDHLTDADVLALQLENAMQRRDLTPLEEARGIKALIKSAKATAAEIAKSLSRSERFVADRLRLLTLTPELQQLLDQGRIGVDHADLLSKLTPEQQARASSPGTMRQWGGRVDVGGLWDEQGRTLDLEPEGDELKAAQKADPYRRLKVATVKELARWIADHVRFDVDQMAKAAPLEFEHVKGQVEAANAKVGGRGKKVVYITHSHQLTDEVKKEGERTYGPASWKRADDTIGTSRDGKGKRIDSMPCEHSVLGVVVAGRDYQRAFQVCVAKDLCRVHWGSEIREKEKRAKLRASGQGDKANARENRQREKEADAEKRREADRRTVNALYRRVYPALSEAVLAATPAANSPAGVAFLWDESQGVGAPKMPKAIVTVDDLVGHLVRESVEREKPNKVDASWTNHQHELDDLLDLAKRFGVDGNAIVDAEKKAIAHEAKAAAKSTTVPPAKKAAAKGKAAKKR